MKHNNYLFQDILAVVIALAIAIPLSILILDKTSTSQSETSVPNAPQIMTVPYQGTYIKLFGLDGYYTEEEPIKDYFVKRTYFIADAGNECFYKVGESWGFEIEDYETDIDGDGLDELVCNCVWGGDGVREVYIYKIADGCLYIGTVDRKSSQIPEYCNNTASSFQSWYVKSKDSLYVQYDIDEEGHPETKEVTASAIKYEKLQKLEPENRHITVETVTAT